METEVAIVGAGPAGLAAAAMASEAGCRVTLIDSYARPGGQYYKQTPLEFHAQKPAALHTDFSKAAALLAQLEGNSHVQILTNTTVWTAQNGPDGSITLSMQTNDGSQECTTLHAHKLVLAPGAYDRVLPFPSWDLPGVISAGAAQTLAKSQRILPGKRLVLSGSGPFLLPVGAGLAQAGAEIVGIYEATTPLQLSKYAAGVWGHWDKLLEGRNYLKILSEQQVPLHFGKAVIAARGHERVEQVTVARLRADWTPISGSEEVLDVDTVCVGYGFLPSLELALLLGCAHRYDPIQATHIVQHDNEMQSSQRGIFVAGEITGIGGSAVALAQGKLAGLAVAQQLKHISIAEAQAKMIPYREEVRHTQAFADTLNRMFALRPGWLRWLEPETLVCRCEEVTYQQIAEAIYDYCAHDVKTVKALTRCGMGMCQGRVCGHAVVALTATLTGNDPARVGALISRPIIKPVRLASRT